MTKRQLLLINTTKGWCLPLKGGSDGLLAAQMERLLMGDVHELLTVKQVNKFRSKRGKPGRCPVRLLGRLSQPGTRSVHLSLEIFSEIVSHVNAHILEKLMTIVALAMSCQAIYETVRPLLRAALNAASRWDGDEVVILGPHSELHLLPPHVQRWCVAPGHLLIVDDGPKRMEQAAQIICAIKAQGLLSRKRSHCAAMDITVFVRSFLTDDTPYRPYKAIQVRAVTPPKYKRALAMVWFELVSAQQATFDHTDGRERFLCNYSTREVVRQSAFQDDFLSLTRFDTVSSRLQLGDIVALLIASSSKCKGLDFSSSSGIDMWNGPWAGDAFVFFCTDAQLAGYQDVSDTISDFLLEARASDIMPCDDTTISTADADNDNADEPECNDEGNLAGQETAVIPSDCTIPVIRVTTPVDDA